MRTFLALSASPPRLRQSLWMTNCRAASLITRTHARALQPQVNPQWAPLGAQRFKDLLEVSLAAASPFVTLAILSHLPHSRSFPFGTRHGVF